MRVPHEYKQQKTASALARLVDNLVSEVKTNGTSFEKNFNCLSLILDSIYFRFYLIFYSNV